MESDATIDHKGAAAVLHVPVHIGIDKAEDDGLIAYERLVVRLGIRDGLLVSAAVGHLIEDMAGFPVFIFHLLNHLNPEIGDTHSQAVVKADAAILDGISESGHARHLLSDGDSRTLHLMDELIGEGEVADGIAVLVEVVIIAIAAEILAEAVTAIDHRGDAIKAEAIEVILIQPELAVGEEEMQYGGLLIIEAERIPSGVLASRARVEILIRSAIEIAESLLLILH